MTDDESPRATTSAEQQKLDDFAARLSESQLDANVGQAEIADYWVDERRETHFGPKNQEHETGPYDGLVFLFETTTGKTFTKWLKRPGPDEQGGELFVLLEYLDLQPTDIDNPETVLGERVPVFHDHDEWQIDWEEIDQTVQERRQQEKLQQSQQEMCQSEGPLTKQGSEADE